MSQPPAQLRDIHRGAGGLPWLAWFGQDLRFAIRSLRKTPGFLALAVGCLGLGLGATTALFSLVDALLLRPLPVTEPDRLVWVHRTDGDTGKRVPVDARSVEALGSIDRVFSGAGSYVSLIESSISIDGSPESDRVVVTATANFLRVAGARPALGRLDADEPVAVISHRFWRARFDGSPDAIGRAIAVNDRSYPIAGVIDGGFLGVSLDASVDIWLLASPPAFFASSALARLQPGVTLEQARTAAEARLADLPLPPGMSASSTSTEVLSASRGMSTLRDQYRHPLVALVALVALVLLVTWTNLANLLVVRNTARLGELAVRASLGARRARLICQLLAECAIVAAGGVAVAWLLARWGVATVLTMLPLPVIPEQLQFHTDVRLMVFMAGLASTGALLFGFVPAWRATSLDVSAALKPVNPSATSRPSRRPGLWLVAGQIALSVVLMTGAGLFFRSLRNMTTVDLGFNPDRLIQVEIADRAIRYRREDVPVLHRQLVEGISAVAGVEAVTLGLPLFPAWAENMPEPPDYGAGIVGPDYFTTLQIPLVRGRLFTADDVTRAEGVSIVNETFARRMFPGDEVIGKRAGYNSLEIVGVVKDQRYSHMRWNEAIVYRIGTREGRLVPGLFVRAAGDPRPLLPAIRAAVAAVDQRLPRAVRLMDDVIARALVRERLVATTSAAFALLGLALAGLGLFGVAALAVSQRTNEFGLRLALGASRARVARESLRETTRVFGAGLLAGLVLALAGTRLAASSISGLLFGMAATDWVSVAGAAALMIAAAVAACLIPAIRAARIDPLRSIRAR